ncbi:hypothetical protein P7C73_g5231, partial [Tremellales sp. Uapishka_1]
MLAPKPRYPTPASYTSTSPPLSDSMSLRPSRASTATSVSLWSEHGTEVQDDHDQITVVGRGTPPLIDFGSDGERERAKIQREKEEKETGPTPTERLKLLLRQMEAEVRATSSQPVDVHVQVERSRMPSPRRSVIGPSWRDDRRREIARSGDVASAMQRSPSNTPGKVPVEDEEEEGSPPTPPMRITNTYLRGSRRVSEEQKGTTTPPIPRIPSRAAVLYASTSSQSPTSPVKSPRPKPAPTPLERYISSHPVPVLPPIPDPWSSRSYEKASRKGKERASPEPVLPPRNRRADRFAALRDSTSSSDQASLPFPHVPPTPRQRTTIDAPPDNSVSFAKGLEQVGGEIDLELDSGSDVPWEGEDETEESGLEIQPATTNSVASRSREYAHSTIDQTALPARSRETSYEQSRSKTFQGREYGRSLELEKEERLPALPEPEEIQADDEEEQVSSRRRTFFRSPLRPVPRDSVSPQRTPTSPRLLPGDLDRLGSPSSNPNNPPRPDTSSSYRTTSASSSRFHSISLSPSTHTLQIPPQPPIKVNMLLSTPTRPNTTISGNTPKPPGGWAFTPAGAKSKVRFTPSPSKLKANESVESTIGDVSIHRLRLSPAKVKPIPPIKEEVVEAEADTSWSGKLSVLKKSLSRKPRPIPPPSTTLLAAQTALHSAAQATDIARRNVEQTQRQWLEALSHSEKVGLVVRQSAGWSRWAWWISMEILLVWGVFRVTIDYASSSANLSLLDPLNFPFQSSTAMSIPMNSAITAFGIDRKVSMNFFDLLESMDLWRRTSGLGIKIPI